MQRATPLHPVPSVRLRHVISRLGLGLAMSAVVAASAACPIGPPESVDPPTSPGTLVRSELAFNAAPDVDVDAVADATAGQYDLAAELLTAADAAQNLAVSPTSIAMAFAMLSAGARGTTLEELESGLSLPAQETLHPAMNGLLVALRDRDLPATEESDGLELAPVNALFPQEGFEVETPYLDTLGTRYDAGLHLMNYVDAPEASRLSINGFVDENTRGRISELLPAGSIDPSTRLVLVNALYLKGAWAEPFEAERTADGVFHTANGDVTASFLHGVHNNARHLVTREHEIVELPLVGGELVLDIVRSSLGAGADATVAPLAATLRDLSSSTPTPVDIALPKFKVRLPMDLIPALRGMGVDAIFDNADLSGISSTTDLTVTGAFHETFFALDEKGIEAAAATAIVTGETSVPPPPVTVVIDEPFTFILRDVATNTPLFVGQIADPTLPE